MSSDDKRLWVVETVGGAFSYSTWLEAHEAVYHDLLILMQDADSDDKAYWYLCLHALNKCKQNEPFEIAGFNVTKGEK